MASQQGSASKRLALLHRLSLAQHGIYSLYCDFLLALLQVLKAITCHDLTLLCLSHSRRATLRYCYWTPLHLNQAQCLPAIISDIPVHRELHEDSALFFDIENDLDFLGKALDRLVGSIDLWRKLSVSRRSLAASWVISDQQSKIKCLMSQ